MILRHDGGPGFAADGDAFIALMVVGPRNHGDVDQSAFQLGQDLVAAAVSQLIMHLGVLSGKIGDPLSGVIRSVSFHHADTDLAGQRAAERLQIEPGFVGETQDLARPAQQQFAGLRQREAALAADEKLRPEVLLQLPDAVAERRLAHLQLLCSPREIQFFRNGDKIL